MEADATKIAKSQSKFDELLRAYTEDSGISRDDIDDELADAQQRMATLSRKGRHQTPEGSALRNKIADFESLVELRKVVVGQPRPYSRLAPLHVSPLHSTDISPICRTSTHPIFIHTSHVHSRRDQSNAIDHNN